MKSLEKLPHEANFRVATIRFDQNFHRRQLLLLLLLLLPLLLMLLSLLLLLFRGFDQLRDNEVNLINLSLLFDSSAVAAAALFVVQSKSFS